MEALKARSREERLRKEGLRIERQDVGDGRAFTSPIAFNVLLTLAFKRLPSWEDVFCL